jgi:hypothetical protein
MPPLDTDKDEGDHEPPYLQRPLLHRQATQRGAGENACNGTALR